MMGHLLSSVTLMKVVNLTGLCCKFSKIVTVLHHKRIVSALQQKKEKDAVYILKEYACTSSSFKKDLLSTSFQSIFTLEESLSSSHYIHKPD